MLNVYECIEEVDDIFQHFYKILHYESQ